MRPEAKCYFLERGIRFMLSGQFGRKDSDRLLVPGDLLEKVFIFTGTLTL